MREDLENPKVLDVDIASITCDGQLRKQLLNPNEQIFRKAFWIIQDLPKDMWSFHFVEKRFEAAMPIFYLETEASERNYYSIIGKEYSKCAEWVTTEDFNRRCFNNE